MLSALSLRHGFRFGRSHLEVLRGVSLELRPGELTLISGPSGSGKSTLLAILSGLLQPLQGHITSLGRDLRAMSAAERDLFRLRHTAFVFQGFNLFPALSALEQVCTPLAYLGIDRAEATTRAMAALCSVGLEHRLHARPAALSGGEQQRVALARAIAKRPDLLFADEPTSALDAENGRTVIRLLRTAAHESRKVVLCVSHDPRLIASADRVLQMEDGRIHGDTKRAIRLAGSDAGMSAAPGGEAVKVAS